MHVVSMENSVPSQFPSSGIHIVIKRLICLNARPSFDIPVGDILLCVTSDTKVQGLMEYSNSQICSLGQNV